MAKRLPNNRKPAAADRTVDMFTGKTKLDEAAIGETSLNGADLEKVEKAEGSPAIEDNCDRWRSKALEVEECLDTVINPASTESMDAPVRFRLTSKGDLFYLERMEGQPPWSYLGITLRRSQLRPLTEALVKVCKELKL